MALGPRLDIRQSQSLVMTPQLQQAIKLLTLSNLEIEAFIGDALDANPLLEIGDAAHGDPDPGNPPAEDFRRTTLESSPVDQLVAEGHAADDRPLDIDTAALDRDRDTGDWGGDMRMAGGEDGPDIGERGEGAPTLAAHLHAQIGLATRDPGMAFVARHLADQLDESGYLQQPLRDVVHDLGITAVDAEAALALLQSLDPTGIGARSLGECLALQAREADRYDPCMARLLDNLDLLGRGELARLKRMCNVDDEDFAEMLAEIRSYDPRPGIRFASGGGDPVVPDVLITPRRDGGWDIALNQATLPRLIINRSYYVEMRGACDDKTARGWLSEKLADATWLVKALDQRQKTILKVASELVAQQDGFFRNGVSYLKPLTLRNVADAIAMHESTVSRVTSNKYLLCERGTFELKYFFTSGVGAVDGEGGASAEAVKAAIKALIDAESAKSVLSDDTLVDLLKDKGFELARRTVAKYREAIGIGSSVQRRRAKALAGVR